MEDQYDSMASYYAGKLSLEDFAVSVDKRPTVPFNHFPKDDELPVVDMSHLIEQSSGESVRRKEALETMCKAAEEWGFFRLVNHNVPLDLIARLEGHADRFFSLQLDQKMKCCRVPVYPFGYGGGSHYKKQDKWWIESLHFPCDKDDVRIKRILEAVWPVHADYEDFRADVARYVEYVQSLSHQLRQFLTECLAVIPSYFDEFYGSDSASALRFNYYPPCPKPDLIVGIHEHTDPGTLTILHQDSTGGLQIRKDGKWVGVKPIFGSFVVNLGDCFQAFSNGRFKSAVHRGVLNTDKSRLSIVFFYNASDDAIVQPAPPLLGAHNPPLYKPITWATYRNRVLAGEVNAHSLDYIKLQSGDPDSHRPKEEPLCSSPDLDSRVA